MTTGDTALTLIVAYLAWRAFKFFILDDEWNHL